MECQYKNKNNGDVYTVLEEGVINTTNNVAGEKQKMVIYRKGALLFCREEEEFYDKFTRVRAVIYPTGFTFKKVPFNEGSMG